MLHFAVEMFPEKAVPKHPLLLGEGSRRGLGEGGKRATFNRLFFLLRPEIHFTSFCKTKWIFFFPVTIKHCSNNFVCKFWQLSLGWEEGQRASCFMKDCSEGFCN